MTVRRRVAPMLKDQGRTCVGTELTDFTLKFAWFIGSLWLGSKRKVDDHLGP